MKRISAITMVCLLAVTLLAGCRRMEPGTTDATQNNPSTSTSTVRPEPTITIPGTSTTTTKGSTTPRG